jgi:hypothetical protein
LSKRTDTLGKHDDICVKDLLRYTTVMNLMSDTFKGNTVSTKRSETDKICKLRAHDKGYVKKAMSINKMEIQLYICKTCE